MNLPTALVLCALAVGSGAAIYASVKNRRSCCGDKKSDSRGCSGCFSSSSCSACSVCPKHPTDNESSNSAKEKPKTENKNAADANTHKSGAPKKSKRVFSRHSAKNEKSESK